MVKIKFSNILSGLKKIRKFGFFIPMSNLLLVYGQRFFPKSLLSKVSDRRNLLIEQKIANVVGDYDIFKPTSCKEKKIWVLWLQGEDKMPLIPKLCLESIRKNANGYEVVLLTWENLGSYLNLPKRIISLYESGNITAAHLSDIIRVGLLAEYGGFWIDSTMYLTAPIDGNIFDMPFYSMKSEPEGYYVSRCRWAGFCLNLNRDSILAQMLKGMLFKYWEKEDWLIDYFMLDYLIDMAAKESNEVNSIIDELPQNNPHLHDLCPLLDKEFDYVQFKEITTDTSFFKLSWKQYSDDDLCRIPNNFYHKLCDLIKE